MFGASELTDVAIAAAARGDAQALGAVIAALTPQVQMMVAARLSPTPRNLSDIEDLSQVVLSALSEGIGTLRTATVGGLKGFVSAIVSNKVADHLRVRGNRSDGRPRSLDSTVAALSGATPLWQMLSSSGTSPLSAAARAEQSRRLLEELGQLKPDYREAITLAFFDQLTTAQIAEQVGISRPAASMLLMRAVQALRQRMETDPGA